jgi:hypothetical protein
MERVAWSATSDLAIATGQPLPSADFLGPTMTTFWRSGSWRTSVLGNPYWVDGHSVYRDNWDRIGYGNPAVAPRTMLQNCRASRGTTARYVNPNADCPVCGAPVFFYQNEFGSRVYFDELGPPWPKHPCTDRSPAKQRSRATANGVVQPTFRDVDQQRQISAWLTQAGADPEAEFRQLYGHRLWTPYSVRRRCRAPSATVIVLEPPSYGTSRLRFVSAARLPRAIKADSLVFMKRGRLAYFDLRVMKPREIRVTELRSASEVAAVLIGRGGA